MKKIIQDLLLELVDSQGICRFCVGGRSMGNTIRSGAVVEVEKSPFDTLCKGMIVAYVLDSRILVHRIVGTLPGALIIRGDAPFASPHVVSRNSIIGRISRIENPSLPDLIYRRVRRYVGRIRERIERWQLQTPNLGKAGNHV